MPLSLLLAAAVTAGIAALFSFALLQIQGGRQAFKLTRRSASWLIAAGVTCSSRAASAKLRCRAADSKARSALRGGKRELFDVSGLGEFIYQLKKDRLLHCN